MEEDIQNYSPTVMLHVFAKKIIMIIYIYIYYSWPNGWIKLADTFWGNPGVTLAKRILFTPKL